MTNKIELDSVESGYGLSKINDNFQKIEDELNNKVLYRDNVNGSPNEMSNSLDMNGERIYNLPRPTSASEPLRLIDAAEIAAGGEFPINLTISSAGTGESLVKDPSGIIRSIEGTGSVTAFINGDVVEINSTAQNNTASNLGAGAGVYANKLDSDLRFKSIKAGTNVTVSDNGSEITIASTGGTGGTGEANTASNVGTGNGLFKTKSGVDLQFKSLKAGTNVTLTPGTDDITISAAGGGGGTFTGYADITDYGAVADFVPGAGSTGTGTDNATALINAAASGKPIWIPPGNYYFSGSTAKNALNVVSQFGSGQLWTDTNVGKTKFGKMLSIGSTRSHEMQSVGGIHLGGETGNGFRWYMGHHNWSQIQPTKYGAPTQFQLYPSVCCGTATTESPNILNAVHNFFDANVMTVGDHIGFFNKVYKIASIISGSKITVTNFDGSSPSFTTDAANPRTFYHSYETAGGTCNTNGTSFTFLSGEQLPYGLSMDHMYVIINGTKYNVTQGPESLNANSLTLATSAGVQTNVPFEFRRCWGYFAYVTLLRLQGLGGGLETNCGLYLNIRNEAVLFNSGYGSSLAGDMRINARKTYIGPGDGTGGTEVAEFGDGYCTLGRVAGSTAGNYVEVNSFSTSFAPVIKAMGPGADIDLAVYAKGTGGVQLGAQSNNVKVYAAGSGFAPSITVRSSGTNKDLGFDLSDYGTFRFTAGTYTNVVAEVISTSGSTGFPQLIAGNAIATVSAGGSVSNVDLQLTPKGTGRLLPKGIPFVLLRRTGALSLPANAGTTVSWDTEDVDNFGMHTAGASIITAPVTGLYHIESGYVMDAYSLSGSRVITSVYLIVNGVAVRNTPFIRHGTTNGVANSVGSALSIDYYLTAGDQVQIQFYYGTDSTTAATLSTSFNYNYFNMRLVTS